MCRSDAWVIWLQVWAYAKLLPRGQPLFGPPQALLSSVPQHVVRQLADDSQHHKVRRKYNSQNDVGRLHCHMYHHIYNALCHCM